MRYKKIVIVNVRSAFVNYMPTYELFLAEGMKTKEAAETIGIYTLTTRESPEQYYEQWRDADLFICWEAFSTKAPSYVYKYLEIAEAIRNNLNRPVFFGGFWATSYGRYFREFDVFDRLIEGYSIDAIAEAIRDDISNGRFIDASGDSNYDVYPLNPSYLATPEKYMLNGCLSGYMSSFSCPRNCAFCFSNAARSVGSGFRARDIETIKKDIDALDEYFKFDRIIPKDLNIFYDRDRAFAFLDYLRHKGKRVDVNLDVTIKDIDEDLFRKLRELGIAEELYFGLESFNEEHRKRIGKPFTTEEMEAAFDLAESYGINMTGNIILGLPWQTAQDVEREIRTALKYINRYKRLYIMFNIYKPEYGTRIQKEYFPDLHEKISFRELVDLYLNEIGQYRSLIYGREFEQIDLEKIHIAMRLVNNSKRGENGGAPLRGALLRAFRKSIENQLIPPYFGNPFVRVLLRRRFAVFFTVFMVPAMSRKLTEINPLRIYRFLKFWRS